MGMESFTVGFVFDELDTDPIEALRKNFDITDNTEKSVLDGEYFVIRVDGEDAIQIRFDQQSPSQAELFLRFSYCCPVQIDDIFLDVCRQLMEMGAVDSIQGYIHPSLENGTDASKTLRSAIDYLRQLWFLQTRSELRMVISPSRVWEEYIRLGLV